MTASAPAAPRHDADSRQRAMAPVRHDGLPGNAYAFYPTPRAFGALDTAAFGQALERSNAVSRPLSLHVHVPFCRRACYHCARRPTHTTDTRLPEAYLTRLDREMVLIGRHLDTTREVRELHWGGGTPTFLTLDQMGDLIDRLAARFRLAMDRDRDYSIEIDPRETDVFTLRHLEALGFNHLTLGVLDLDPRVQKAINRVQPRALTEQLIDEADRLGFRSLTLELIIGLPCQTRDGFAATLEQVLAMAPARLALFHYAHHPERFAAQRHIHDADLPEAEEILSMQAIAVEMLDAAGYVHLGRDRYARRGTRFDEARRQATRLADRDLVGLGVAAVSRLADLFARSAIRLADYEAALDAGRLPTTTGHHLTLDDRLRGAAIERLMTDLELDLDDLGHAFGIDAAGHLAEPLARLTAAAQAGLIERRGPRLGVTPRGRLRLRELAAAFDAFVPTAGPNDGAGSTS